MQDLLSKNEKMSDALFLIEKVYGKCIQIEEGEDAFFLHLDGEEYILKDYQDALLFLKRAFFLRCLETKKDVYDKLLKLSELYLTFLKDKRKREVLKEAIPSVEKVVSYFFDVSKYCSDEHIFDDFYTKDLSYDKLLVLFPKMIENVKASRKKEKEEELKTWFSDCKNFSCVFRKLDKLLKNEQAYQDALLTVYPNYSKFFEFYSLIKKRLDKNQKVESPTYEFLYDFFLHEVIRYKKEEIESENQMYHALLEQYQDLTEKRTIFEKEEEFEVLKITDSDLKREVESVTEEEEKEKCHLETLEEEFMKVEKERETFYEKHFLGRIFLSKRASEIEERYLELYHRKIEVQEMLEKLSKKRMRLMKRMVTNEHYLSEICGFPITIFEYEEKLRTYKEEFVLSELIEEEGRLVEELMKFHIEKKEEELKEICVSHGIPFENTV